MTAESARFEWYALAHHLNRPLAEIMDMPVSELVGWRQYFKIMKDRNG